MENKVKLSSLVTVFARFSDDYDLPDKLFLANFESARTARARSNEGCALRGLCGRFYPHPRQGIYTT